MSNTTIPNFIDTLNNNNLIVEVNIGDRYASFDLYAYNPDDFSLEGMPHQSFDFIGDMSGPIMPHLAIVNNFDVGPLRPCVKAIMTKADDNYHIMLNYYRAIHIGYYTAILKTYMEANGLQWKNGLTFYGFVYAGPHPKKQTFMCLSAATSEGITDNIFDKIKYIKKVTELTLREKLGIAFGNIPDDSTIINIPREKNLLHEKTDRLYLTLNLGHKKFPDGVKKYRERNAKPADAMLRASNWGIVIPVLAHITQNGKQIIMNPTRLIDWVDNEKLGYREVTSQNENNYFVGKVIYNAKQTTHFGISKTLDHPIMLKFNLSCTCNLWKLPGESKIGGPISSGFADADIGEEAILAMHKPGSGSTSMKVHETKTIDEGVQPPKLSKALKSKSRETDDEEVTKPKKLKSKVIERQELSDEDQ